MVGLFLFMGYGMQDVCQLAAILHSCMASYRTYLEQTVGEAN